MGPLDRDGAISEIFDLPSLWNRVGGDVDLLREMVEIFTSECPQILAQLDAAISGNDPTRVERASHMLKGSLVQFSARTAAETAGKLEEMGKEGALQGAGTLAHHLRHQVDELLQAMNLVVSQRVTE